MLKTLWLFIVKIWDILIFIPIINLLYIILAFNPHLGIAIIILTVLIRTLLLPTSYHQLWVAKLNAKFQKKLSSIKKKHVRKKVQKELYKKHKFNPLSGIGVLILSFPIMIALYKVLPIVSTSQSALSAFDPYLYSATKTFVHSTLHLSPSQIQTVFHGINLAELPTKALIIMLAITAGIQTLLNILFMNSQTYEEVLKTTKTQFKIPNATENDYKLIAKTMYYSKFFNAITNAILMAWIFQKLPAIFAFYMISMNIYNIITLPILNYIIEKRLPEVK